MTKLLLIEDDKAYCKLLTEYLRPEGFTVTAIHDGEQAIALPNINDYDIIILDVMLPGLNGLEVLRHLNQSCQVPILMLTARGEEVDRIVGLEMGADDYLAKPCNPRELLARLKAILRRGAKQLENPVSTAKLIKVSDIEVSPQTRAVKIAGVKLELTNAEYNILEYLARHPGKIISKETLSQHGLSRSLNDFDRSIDVHVSHLRNKLNPHARGKQYIKTARGVGYFFSPEE